MCFGNSAADEARRARQETERREQERQEKVSAGKVAIDNAFARFGDDYYRDYTDTYTDYYFPQIDDQFDRASAKLVAALAGRGVLDSTPGIDARSQLLKQYNTQRTGIANEAVDAANRLKGTVENTKTDMYTLNQAAADPEAMGARAVGQATALVAPPTTSPLSQVFASFLAPYLQNRQNASLVPAQQYAPISRATGAGSARVVN